MKSLLEWIDAHKILVCLGPGGVGKTTVTSALGLHASSERRRTLCMTIDPARRLAESLGIQGEAEASGKGMIEVPVRENLWAMMVDAQTAVDVATRRHLGAAAEHAMESNRIFRYLRNTLAGFHEFACMDVLLDLVDRGIWDTIILDTPPSQHARDFLEAPRRIEEAVTSPVLNLFVDAGGKGLPGRGLVGLGTGMTMRVIGRLIGQGLVEEVAEFLILGGDMLKGFHARAARMREFLDNGDLGFAVVTSPETAPECIRLDAMLGEMGFRDEFFVMNRVLTYARDSVEGLSLVPMHPVTVIENGSSCTNGDAFSPGLARKIEENFVDTHLLSEAQLRTLTDLVRKVGRDHSFYVVPQLAEDVFDLPALERLLDSMLSLELAADGAGVGSGGRSS